MAEQTVAVGRATRRSRLRPLRFDKAVNCRVSLALTEDCGRSSQHKEIFGAAPLNLEGNANRVYRTLNERSGFESIDVLFCLRGRKAHRTIIEAMAHGKPIIATAVGGIPDVVSADVGILVPPNDVRALADAITLLANDGELRKRMGQAARRKYEQVFTPQAVMPLLTGLYERVVNQQNRNGGGGSHPVPGAGNGEHPWAISRQE